MRQVREVIHERRSAEEMADLITREAEVRILAAYSARTAKAQKAAAKIMLFRRPRRRNNSYERAVGLFGTSTEAPEVLDG